MGRTRRVALPAERGGIGEVERLLGQRVERGLVAGQGGGDESGSLRAKLGDPSLIQTVRGVGYRLRDLPADEPGPG